MSARAKFLSAFAIIYVIWGSTYLAIRYGVETIPPFLMAGTRFLLAGAILYIWSRARGNPPPTRRHWRNAAIVGTLLLLGGNGAVVWAEQTVPSGIAALFVATVPLWLVLLSWARPGGERPSLGVILGVLVGLAGIVELVGVESFRGVNAEGVPLAGTLALLVGSLVWSIGTLYAKSADLPRSTVGSAMEMIAGGVALLIASAITGEPQHLEWRTISMTSVLGWAYLTIFGSLIAYTAYSWLVQHASPAALGTYAYVNPVVAVFLGWFVADEVISSRTLIGAAIIIAAVIVITTTRKNVKTADS